MSGTTPFIVAIIALVVSVIALTWQVIQFLLTNSRVVVELKIGALGLGKAVTAPIDGAPDNLTSLVEQGFDTPVLAIIARNKGRLGVTVSNWDIALGNGISISFPGWHFNDGHQLPHRLEPGAAATWYCPIADVGRAFANSNQPLTKIRARVDLATGKTVRSVRHNGQWLTQD